MRYIIWALRLVVFILIVLFATKNTQTVVVSFYGGWAIDIPLILVILGSFILGALYMYLLSLPTRFTRSREISRLKGEVQDLQTNLQNVQHADQSNTAVTAVVPPDGFVANR